MRGSLPERTGDDTHARSARTDHGGGWRSRSACRDRLLRRRGYDGRVGRPGPGKTVVVATHDSWAMSEERARGVHRARPATRVKVEPNGDAGQLTNKLVLTKGSPIADMTYGIDNTFASRAVDEGVLADYTPKHLPASVATTRSTTRRRPPQLTPVDYGDVCVNVDDTWFAKHDLTPPRVPRRPRPGRRTGTCS